MSEIDNQGTTLVFIVKSIEEIKSDVKSIYRRLETITQDLHSYKNQKYRCQASCDNRYLRLAECEAHFKQEIEKFIEKRDESVKRKSEIIKNIISIIIALSPYIVMVGSYFLLIKSQN